MSDIKPFIWAQGQDANVKEPIQALQESGWRYGDVPTASNFNWLFKRIGDNLSAQEASFKAQIKTLNDTISNQAKIIEEQKKRLSSAVNNINDHERTIDVLYKSLTHLIAVNVQMVTAINSQVSTALRPSYPFRYTSNGGLPVPIRDIEFDL